MEQQLPIYIGRDAIPQFIAYCVREQRQRFTLVADANTYAVLGKNVETALHSQGFDVNTVILGGDEIIADEHYIVQVLLAEDRTNRVNVAVGSGTITDLTRIVSHRGRAQFISIPTAPSVDAYTSGTASLVIERLKQTIPAFEPIAIFADLPTLCAAPRKMIAAGFGDLIGKYTALADWQLGHLLWNEPYNEMVAERAQRALVRTVARASEIGRASGDGIQTLFEGLCESGFCMAAAGYSRPAAGAEHYVSHYLETKLLREHRPAILHGAKVGLATIRIAGYYEKIKPLSAQDAVALLNQSKLPDRHSEITRIQKMYGVIANQIVDVQAPFLDLTNADYETLKEKIAAQWQTVLDIASTVPSPQELTNLLREVGGAVTPAELGLSEAEVSESLEYSHYFRNRFTVLKLSRILDLA